MSAKIEGIIAKLNKNLENMTKKLSEDGLTGLQMKQTFETDMKKRCLSQVLVDISSQSKLIILVS